MKKTPAVKHEEFLRMAFCTLVLRGYNRERDIPDPILRKAWRLGKRLQQRAQGRSKQHG